MREMFEAIKNEIKRKPPTIGIIGVSGVGKSSTINTLFKTGLATSDTVACTKKFWDIDAKAEMGVGGDKKTVRLVIKDAPGLGEDIDLDPYYLQMYQNNLGDCDVVLWILAARNRAIALDQQYIVKLKEFHNNMVFAVNQVDLIEPMNWDSIINLPSDEQEENIKIIVKDREEKLSKTLGKAINVIPYSSKTKYNLQELFSALLNNCPEERGWIFDAIKGFHFTDFIPENIKLQIIEEFNKNEIDQINKIENHADKPIKSENLLKKGLNHFGDFFKQQKQ